MKLAELERLVGQDVAVIDRNYDRTPAKAKVIGIVKVNEGSEHFPSWRRKVEVEVTSTRLRLATNEEFEDDGSRPEWCKHKNPGRHVIDGRRVLSTWKAAQAQAQKTVEAQAQADATHARGQHAADRITSVIGERDEPFARPRIVVRKGAVHLNLTPEEAEDLADRLGAEVLEPYS